MALNFGSIFKKVRDVFDANSEEDQRKRMAQGQARFYQDQQNRNVVGSTFQGARDAVKTQGSKVVNTIAPTAKILSNTLTRRNLFDTSQRAQNEQLNQSYGAGVINNAPSSSFADNLKQTVDFGARAASTGSELAPYFVTGPGGKMVVQQGARVLPKIAGFNAAQSAIGSAGTQLNETGKIDPRQLLTDTALGTAIGTGGSALFAGASKVLGGVRPKVAPRAIASDINPSDLQGAALQSHLGKAELKAQQVADFAATQARAADPELQAFKVKRMDDLKIKRMGETPDEPLKVRQFDSGIDPNTGMGKVKFKDDGTTVTIGNDVPESILPKAKGKGTEAAMKQAKATEKLKAEGKITPKDSNYWSTPIKGESKGKIPDVKDINGVVPKEGDTIKFSSIAPTADGSVKTGTSTVKWNEPQIANASGKRVEGFWSGNGRLDNGQPFEVVKPAGGAKPKVTAKAGETRGFEKNMTKANAVEQNPTAQAVIEAMPGYTPITNKATMAAASQEVLADPTAALDDVLTKPQLDNAKDVMKSNVLLKQAVEDGDTETAIQLGTKLGMDGTQLGQAIQAYSTWKKTTPEGVIKFATKEALKSGKPLQKELAESLVTQARALADMPEGVEKAVAARSMLNDVAQANRTWRDVLSEIINMPRAAMATADLSAPLRQGAVLGARNPKEFARGFVEQLKYFKSKDSYEKAMYEISQRPTYEMMRQSKLAVSAAEQLSGTEEQFMNNFLESNALKKLGVGHVVAGSDRAYSGFLTKLRADVFDKIVTKSKDAGVELDDKALKSLATYINSASGRGNLGGLERHAGLLSQALFSPRLWKSRIDVLNPVYYARLDPVARKYALETTASFAAVVSTVLGLAALGGAEVGTDPRSADFAKIKVGNTRYDIMGGLQQNIRLAAQMITGEKIDSSTGLVQTLGPERGFGKPSRYDLLTQFIENKENPVIGYATKMLKGTDPTGEAYKPVEELAKLFIPLTIQGTYETIKDQNSVAKGVAMNVPGLFGVGTQTYDSQIDQEKRSKELVSREKKDFQKQGGRGKELSDGKYYTKVGDEYRTFDSKEKADIATFKEDFKKSDKKSAVSGDTYFYKDKSGEVKTKPKVLYEWEQTDAKANLKMDRAYEAGDLGAWAEAATAKYDGLEKKKALYDPQTEQDEIDKITLAQENLQQKAEKYAAKGIGGSSGSKGRKATAVDARKYGVSLRQGGKIAVGKVSAPKVSTKAPTRKTATAKPKVSIKKSLV